jgi:hypothetical protein
MTSNLLITLIAIATLSPGIRCISVSNFCIHDKFSPIAVSKSGCFQIKNTLRLRGGSWNPVKWFEDAFENTVKEDVNDMLHQEKDIAVDGSEGAAANGKDQSRHVILKHVFIHNP